jgi:SOS-response transcriptional repressor LexA
MTNAWIAQRLKHIGKPKKGLAAALGIEAPRVSEMLADERNIRADEIEMVADYLQMGVTDLLASLRAGKDVSVAAPMIRVRVIGNVQAGHFAEATEIQEDDQEIVDVPRPDGHPRYFGLRVKGESMNLEYPEGSLLICVPIGDYDQAVEGGDHVICRQQNDAGQVEATVKEVVIDDNGQWWLWPRSSRPEHQTPIKLPRHIEGDIAAAPDIELAAIVVADYRVRNKKMRVR